jgi:hypothetical protein
MVKRNFFVVNEQIVEKPFCQCCKAFRKADIDRVIGWLGPKFEDRDRLTLFREHNWSNQTQSLSASRAQWIFDESDQNSGCTGIRESLPQADESVALQGAAWATLEAAFSGATGSGPVLLPDESAATLMDSVPEEFRNSCDAMVANWAAKGKAKWTVRVLFSLRRPEGTKALLALRCASTAQGQGDYYDERPAIVSFTPETATLKLIPLAPQDNGDPTLYRLDFSQAFTVLGAQLVELQVYHSEGTVGCHRLPLELKLVVAVLALGLKTDIAPPKPAALPRISTVSLSPAAIISPAAPSPRHWS